MAETKSRTATRTADTKTEEASTREREATPVGTKATAAIETPDTEERVRRLREEPSDQAALSPGLPPEERNQLDPKVLGTPAYAETHGHDPRDQNTGDF